MVCNFEQLKEILKGMEIPGTYYQFSEEDAPGLPFYVYFSDGSETFPADNMIYVMFPIAYIELYTKNKDVDMEKKMERILDENELPFLKEEDYLYDEKCHMTTYTIQFVEGEENA